MLGVAVALGFAFQAVASKRCFCDKSQLKWRFWSYDTLVLETCRVNLGGGLGRNARFADFKCEFLRKSRAKRSFCRLDV